MTTKSKANPTKRKAQSARATEYPTSGLAKISQAADFLNTSKFTVYRLINSQKLPSIAVGGQKRIPWEVLHKHVQVK